MKKDEIGIISTFVGMAVRAKTPEEVVEKSINPILNYIKSRDTALRQSLVKEVEEINKADAGPHDTVYRRDVLKIILQEKE